MADEVHFPGKTEAEFSEPAPVPVAPPAPAPSEAPKGDTPPAPPKPGDEAPKDELPKDEPAPPAPPLKKRSIYDDLKDTRQEKNAFKDAAIAALQAQGVTLTGQETAEELQALAKRTPAPKPADKPAPPAPAPADDLDQYAKDQNLDATALARLVEIIQKRIPASQLSEEDRKELSDLKNWKTGKEAADARAAEDTEIRSQAPAVKATLEIHNDAELAKVMEEIVKLAHTPEFHDKEVDYIVYKKRDILAKLVSPKKPSFESGGARVEAEAPAEVAFNGKMTPAQALKAATADAPKNALEIRGVK